MFSLFMTVTAIVGAVSFPGRCELAIMLPDADEDARALAMLGMLISVRGRACALDPPAWHSQSRWQGCSGEPA